MRNNSICYSFYGQKVNDSAATFIYESLHVLQSVKTVSFNLASLFELLLLQSGDIEVYPGPKPRDIPELDALLKDGLHIFHQTVRGINGI